jgi:hypothetical protein
MAIIGIASKFAAAGDYEFIDDALPQKHCADFFGCRAN